MTAPTPEALYKQLLYICNFLERTNIAYIVVGGIAVSIWVAPRATVDLDFVIGLMGYPLRSGNPYVLCFPRFSQRTCLMIFP